MGVSNKCVGRSLYNHLKQKEVEVTVNYVFDKEKLLWNGTLSVYGVTYQTNGQQNKTLVLETLMKDAESFIQTNLSSKKNAA
jgi:hypothetical protein